MHQRYAYCSVQIVGFNVHDIHAYIHAYIRTYITHTYIHTYIHQTYTIFTQLCKPHTSNFTTATLTSNWSGFWYHWAASIVCNTFFGTFILALVLELVPLTLPTPPVLCCVACACAACVVRVVAVVVVAGMEVAVTGCRWACVKCTHTRR